MRPRDNNRVPQALALTLTLTLLLAIPATTGCLTPDSPAPSGTPEELPEKGLARGRPAVVAFLDTGANPYHQAFQAPVDGPRVDDYLHLPGTDNVTLAHLSQNGSWQDRRNQDDAFWASVTPGRLYAFEGTRIFGISMINATSLLSPEVTPLLLDENTQGHGTATTGILARHAPQALIVLIQIDDRPCSETQQPGCFLHESIAQGMKWAAEQPWIDIISVSLAVPGNLPQTPETQREMQAYLEASRLAHQNGKLIVNGAGNTAATTTLTDYFAGPPWVIAVGGTEHDSRGSSIQSSRIHDVVANFTAWTPEHETLDGYEWSGGTSFSTPEVAATLAQALHHIRAELTPTTTPPDPAAGIPLAHGTRPDGTTLTVTAHDLREALNLTAQTLGPQDWNPTQPPSNDTLHQVGGQTVPVVAPGAQAGWGLITPDIAGQIAERVLTLDYSLPPEKALTAQWMNQQQATRETYWRSP